MNIKENIKTLLLMGAQISVPFKSKISSWFSELEIVYLILNNTYRINITTNQYIDIDEAIDAYCKLAFSAKNYGYLQIRLRNKNLINDDIDYLHPSQELKKLFKEEAKLVSKEYKFLTKSIKKKPISPLSLTIKEGEKPK